MLQNSHESIWMRLGSINGINDNGDTIADGETIYGEKHAVLLVPMNQ